MKLKIRWLLYLLLIAALASTVTLSRYLTTVTGEGTAAVAAVALDGSITIDVSGLTPGGSKTVTFSVTNTKNDTTSDVTQDYSITVNTTGNLPLTFALQCTDTGSPASGIGINTSSATTGTIWTGGVLPHTNLTTHTYTLTVSWDSKYSDPKYAKEIDAVTLTVNAQQAN